MSNNMALQSFSGQSPVPTPGSTTVDGLVNKLFVELVCDASSTIEFLGLVDAFIKAQNQMVKDLQQAFGQVAEHVYLSRHSFHNELVTFHRPRPLSQEQMEITDGDFDIGPQSRIYQSSGLLAKALFDWIELRPNECIHVVFIYMTDCDENSSAAKWVTPVSEGHGTWPTETAYRFDLLRRRPDARSVFVLKNYGTKEDGERVSYDLGFDLLQHFGTSRAEMTRAVVNTVDETVDFMRTGRFTLR